ncbi:TPA: conjugal transfer protein TraN [Enterobacter hormaechei]
MSFVDSLMDMLKNGGQEDGAATARNNLSQTWDYPSLVAALPYRYYDDTNEIFVNAGSAGFMMEAAPLPGANEQVMAALDDMLRKKLPRKTPVTVILLASKCVGERIDRGVSNDMWKGGMADHLNKITRAFWQRSALHGLANEREYLNITTLGRLMTMYETSGSYELSPGKSFSEGEALTITINNKQNIPERVVNVWKDGKRNQMYHFVITIVYRTGTKVWVPQTTWTESCGFDKKSALTSAGSICTEPGGTRTITVDGKEYSQTNSCWAYSDSYVTGTSSRGNCGSLMDNPACTLSSHSCTTTESGICTHQSETYQCQKTWSSSGLVCGGEYICKSGACDETNGTGDNGFDTAVAKLAGLASAAEDVRDQNSTIDVRAFTGKAMSCRKAFAGFSNCCKDSGWGQDTGLAACNDDELALGKAKAKKITVSVGERCDHKVLGACIQKSKVYCVFDGKLARIIQEQGRRDQLGVKFGSGDSPDCRGITVPELQSIDFDKINFSDFYEDLMKNQKIPDTSAQVQQIKDRIAAQVNQQGGGK